MACNRYYNKKENPFVIINREKHLLLKHYDFLQCKIKEQKLVCYGKYQPTKISKTYTYKIQYNGINSPSVYVINPHIEYNDDIHMYPSDNSLCLYHRTDMFWTSKQHIHDTIIPWTHEWFVFYEIYLITGKWEHPFVPHKGIKTK